MRCFIGILYLLFVPLPVKWSNKIIAFAVVAFVDKWQFILVSCWFGLEGDP